MTQAVGVDINDGMSKESNERFSEWLRENPSNGSFGRYHMDETFSARRISKKS
jgi:hypothetical protein